MMTMYFSNQITLSLICKKLLTPRQLTQKWRKKWTTTQMSTPRKCELQQSDVACAESSCHQMPQIPASSASNLNLILLKESPRTFRFNIAENATDIRNLHGSHASLNPHSFWHSVWNMSRGLRKLRWLMQDLFGQNHIQEGWRSRLLFKRKFWTALFCSKHSWQNL